MQTIWILPGLVLLVLGAELLVRGAAGLARAAGLPPLIIGLTVVAYGTSAPELAVSTGAALGGNPDLAVGNVVGSNTFNVLFILGLSALILPLTVSAQLVRLDVPLMIVVSALVWWLAGDGVVGRGEGIVLVGLLVAYTALLIVLGKRRPADPASEPPADESSPGRRTPVWLCVVLVLAGLVLLVLGARWLVSGAVSLAATLGVSDLLIGLTIVAAGTSMPEVATSIVAALRGQRDIAVGNVVGSNLFNLLGVLGVSAVFAPAGVPVADAALRFDLPVMLAVAFVCLPIFFTGGRIARAEGALLLAYYAAYVAVLVLVATGHPALGTFRAAMLGFVVPLTVLGLAVSVWQHRRSARPARAD